MPFQKGNKLGKGRPPGSGNIITTQIKEKMTMIVHSELQHTAKMFKRLRRQNPVQAVKLLVDIAEYVVSKRGREDREDTTDKPNLSFNFNVNADKMTKEDLLLFFGKRGK